MPPYARPGQDPIMAAGVTRVGLELFGGAKVRGDGAALCDECGTENFEPVRCAAYCGYGTLDRTRGA